MSPGQRRAASHAPSEKVLVVRSTRGYTPDRTSDVGCSRRLKAFLQERSMVKSRRTALAGLLTALAMAGLASPWTVKAAAPAGEESGERTVEDGGTGPYKAIMVGDS